MPEKLEHLPHKKPSVLIAAASTMALNQKQSNNIQWGVEKQSVTCSNKQTTNQLGGGGQTGKAPEASSGGKGMFASWCVVSQCYTAPRAQTLTWMKFIVSKLFLSTTDFKNKELTRERRTYLNTQEDNDINDR